MCVRASDCDDRATEACEMYGCACDNVCGFADGYVCDAVFQRLSFCEKKYLI